MKLYRKDHILMNGAGIIKPFHFGKAAESDKRDLIAELDTMNQLKPHPHVIKLLTCVTESSALILAAVYFIHV